MVNYTTEPDKDLKVQRVIWILRTLYAAIKRNPLDFRRNDIRLETIKELKEKHNL
jgi:hypothetical protein